MLKQEREKQREMRQPISVGTLSDEMRAALETRYTQTENDDERTRCRIILLSNAGTAPPDIARQVGRSLTNVRHVIHNYRENGIISVTDGRHIFRNRRPTAVTPIWKATLLEVVEQSPRQHGLNRDTWSTTLLATYLAKVTGVRANAERVRYHLQSNGYTFEGTAWRAQQQAVNELLMTS